MGRGRGGFKVIIWGASHKRGPIFIGGGDPSRHCVKVYIYLIFKDDNRSMYEFMKFGYSDAIKAR